MADTIIQSDEPIPERRPFQYSLRTLFIITTVLAILCAGLFATPDWIRWIIAALCLFFIPVIFISSVIYCRGYMRTFFIGALITVGPLVAVKVYFSFWFIISFFESSSDSGFAPFMPGMIFFGIIILSMIAGLTAMLVRWIIESAQRKASQIEPSILVSRETDN